MTASMPLLMVWLVLLVSAGLQLRDIVREAREQALGRDLFGLVVGALGVRLVARWTSTHWYSTGGNVLRQPGVFDQNTARLPAPDLLAFEHGLWWPGLPLIHLAVGIASIVLLYGVVIGVRTADGPRRKRLVALGLGGVLAVAPLYVRYSTTESSHIWVVFGFSAAARALVDGTEGRTMHWYGWASLLIAPILCAPIRLESSPLLAAALLFVLAVSPLARVDRRVLIVFATACLAGFALALVGRGETVSSRLSTDIGLVVMGVTFRVLLHAPSPLLVSFFPPVFSLPAIYLAWRRLREKQYRRLAVMVGASFYCAIPSMFGEPIFVELGGGGYVLIGLLFSSHFAAEGIVLAAERLRAHNEAKFRWAVGFGIVALLLSVVPAWFRTYAFMEEYQFIRTHLGERRGLVLALFDENSACGHDIDAAVALPDAAVSAQYPELSWIVLDADSTVDVSTLRFDYYYRGLEVELDLASMEGGYQRMVNGDAESRECHRARMARLQELDREIRAAHDLDVAAREEIVARTFSFIAFPSDRATLTLYEAGQPSRPGPRGEVSAARAPW